MKVICISHLLPGDTVDFINEKKLSELPGESTILTGEIHGEFPESSLPTQMELEVKPGAQIIFIKTITTAVG